MRHQKASRRLGRNYGKRRALLRELSKQLIAYERIITTHAKAKEAQRLVEKLISISKTDTVANRRRIFAVLRDPSTTDKIFKDVAKRFSDRKSGYTRIMRYIPRKGDAAQQSILELVVIKEKEKKPKQVKPPKEEKPQIPQEEKAKPKPEKVHKEKEAEKEKAPKPAAPKPQKPAAKEKPKRESAPKKEAAHKESLMDKFKKLFKKDN